MSRHQAARPARALQIAGWTNIALAAAHVVCLIWAYSAFRAVGIEEDMRRLAEQSGAALPYVVTLIVAAGFLVFGLYGLSGAGIVRRLPLLRGALVSIAAVYILRGTLLGGFAAVAAGDAAQIAFAAAALAIGLGYASGVVAPHHSIPPTASVAAAHRRARRTHTNAPEPHRDAPITCSGKLPRR